MPSIARCSVPNHLTKNCCLTAAGMFLFLQQQHSRTLSHNKAVTPTVKRTAGLFRHIIAG